MQHLAPHITEKQTDGMRLFAAPTKALDVVTVEGSVRGGGNFLPETKELAATLAARLLDAGTAKKSKAQIREGLAARGAHLYFNAGGDRMYFSGNCLPEDLPYLLSTVAECLAEANFAAAELTAERTRFAGSLVEAKSDTATQAKIALARMLYEPGHMNHMRTLAEAEKDLAAVARTDLKLVQRQFGRDGLVLVMAGDLSAPLAIAAAQKAFAKLPKGSGTPPEKRKNRKQAVAAERLVHIADKANIDTYFGAAVPFTREDDLYRPFALFSSMLGGPGLSTGHLMRTVRERDGYTYGINAMPAGFEDDADGFFRVWATFSPDTFDAAVAATRKEIAWFVKHGITEDGLARKKEELIGKYAISLSTTYGLASALHNLAIRGKALSYIDEYAPLTKAVTLRQLGDAAALVPWDALSLAAAGSFRKA